MLKIALSQQNYHIGNFAANTEKMIQAIKENSLDIMVGHSVKNIPVGKSFRDTLLNDINVMAR